MKMKLGKKIVKLRIPILILATLLLIPAAIGYLKTRTNYDILTYLPKDIETMKGQNILAEDFGTGAFSMVVVEGLPDKDIASLSKKLEKVDHVERVLSYASMTNGAIPIEVLPDDLRETIQQGDADLMMVFYDTTLSADETLNAVEEIRSIAGESVFIGGMSAVVIDTKNLSDHEVPIYVAIAVVLCLLVLELNMDSFLIPILFLLSIGCAILYNMGSNVFKGEISYVTKALAAVLQLAVTMDYSIFLWHSYCAEKEKTDDNNTAMAVAIDNTFSSVIGSSITTVAGFIALMFMSFTLGFDMGLVMAKGVVLGVLSCVTILPSMILIFDKAIEKTRHKSLMPDFSKISPWIVKRFYVFLIIFALLIVPAYYGQAHNKVYYNLDSSLPKELESIQANEKLEKEFNMASTHMILLDSNLGDKQVRELIDEVNAVDGVKTTLGIQALEGAGLPREMMPEKIVDILDDGEYQLLFVMS
ncbi:MAG: MMPL family transporter, partial [Eubacterium sp.]|nr:MMPL family transporter [Eubacterium sp.]